MDINIEAISGTISRILSAKGITLRREDREDLEQTVLLWLLVAQKRYGQLNEPLAHRVIEGAVGKWLRANIKHLQVLPFSTLSENSDGSDGFDVIDTKTVCKLS